jgi:hypothetical protein
MTQTQHAAAHTPNAERRSAGQPGGSPTPPKISEGGWGNTPDALVNLFFSTTEIFPVGVGMLVAQRVSRRLNRRNALRFNGFRR